MIESTVIGVVFMVGKVVIIAGISFVIIDSMKTYNKFEGFKRGGNKNERIKGKSTNERLQELNKLQSQ